MYTLFLDLASHALPGLNTSSTLQCEGACIACVTEKETAAIRFVDNRIGDNGLMPLLGGVMKEAGWDDYDLMHIACVIGPGGFTSLRMAVTLANVYGDQLKIPVVGIRLDEVYEGRMGNDEHNEGAASVAPAYRQAGILGRKNNEKSHEASGFLWFHSTKKTQMFVRGFGECAATWKEPRLVTLEELQATVGARCIVPLQWCGELIPEHRAIVDSLNMTQLPLRSIEESLPDLLKHLEYKQQVLQPWYGRGW